ncbi:histone H1-like repetitive region-containing protein [Lentzea sp. E54]|uniref:histone H1-like repetitive region-containing protein n=1 Tax=Lentzea xerophila TaxID=3435883 RepID=UPI003DA21446
MAARGETQANVEVSTLVVPAWRLRWRAPELALVLGERALALASARHDEADRLRAESLVVFAGNRVGRGVRIADRAIDALKAAEAAGEHEIAWLLRVELAACARSVGAPLTGFAAAIPVLEAPDVPAELRASALVQASECLVTVGRGDEPTRALAEADQLYVADESLDDDTRLLLRGLIRAVQAAQHRRWGDIAAAIGAAREGLDLLSRFTEPSADSGLGLGRLTLELVLSLMDANRMRDASDVGTPMLERPVRAPSASTSGWLRLALATRVHLPAGRVALAREMLREAAASAERHQLDTLLAESLLALAHVHEISGELAEALTNLRSAHAAERRRARAVYAVRARLAAEFSGVHRQPADLHQQLASLLRPIEGGQVVTDGVLSAALKQQLRQWRPVQVRKGDGVNVKRARRAAEDMTVDGLSAARQHAADRWRMVQPFGEPDDKSPEPVEPPPASLPASSSSSPSSSDRTVPASGLIASAGAMVSGRRRAARVAAGEIDDDRPTTIAEIPVLQEPPAPQPESPQPEPQSQPQPTQAQSPQLTVEQERKRKVEQQLMELQREARRQIEAERQARAEQRAQAEREAQAAEEAARQEAARQEAARQELERQEAARQEAARQEAARQEAARQEAARQEAARQEAMRQEAARLEAVRQEEARREAARQEAVRRDVARQEAAHQEVARLAVEREEAAREAAAREEAARAETAAREEASRSQSESVLDMLKAQGLRAGGRRRAPDAEPKPDAPSWRVEPPSGLRQKEPAAEPAQPRDFFEGSAPARPDYFADLNTPASPDMPDRPSRPVMAEAFSRLPAAPDFGPHLDEPAYPLTTPAAGFPASADPDERKLPDLDFGSLDFSTPKPPTASIPTPPPAEPPAEEPEPEHKPLPLPPIPEPMPPVPVQDEIPQAPEPDLLSSTFLSAADVEDDATDVPTVSVRMSRPADEPPARPERAQPASGAQTSFGTQAGFGTQSSFGTQTFGTQSGFGTQPGFEAQSAVGTETSYDTRPNQPTPPGPAAQPGLAAQPDASAPPDPATSAAGSGEGTEPNPATQYDYFATQPEPPAQADQVASDTAASPATGEPAVDATGTESPSEPGDRTGRPSSRRRPSDLSLADLLAEALVAYETGRRSDEEQVEAADLSAPDWSADDAGPAPQSPATAEQPALPDSPAEPEPPAATDSPFRRGEPFVPAGTGRSFGVQQDSPAESPFEEGQSFGGRRGPAAETPPSSDASFGTGQPFGAKDPAADAAPSFGAPFQSGQAFGAQQTPPAEAVPTSDTSYQPGLSFGVQQDRDAKASSDTSYRPSLSFGAQQDSETKAAPSSDTPYRPSLSFGLQHDTEAKAAPTSDTPTHPGLYFGSQQLPAEPAGDTGPGSEPYLPAKPRAESEQEKTGPIVPVAAAPDSETTGPIRRVRPDGPVRPDEPAGWTLPGA